MPSDSKSILLSKTFWVNVVAMIAAVGTAFGLNLGLTPEAQTAIVGGILAIVNIILRVATTGPVHVIAPATSTPPSTPPAGPTP